MRHYSIAAALLLALSLKAPVQAQTIAKIEAAGSVTIGFVDGQAPFAEARPDGTAQGYAIDLCLKVVETIRRSVPNLAVSYVEVPLETAFTRVESGEIDMLCSAVTATLGRRELVDFSLPTFVTGMGALVRDDAPQALKDVIEAERPARPGRSQIMEAFTSRSVGVRAGSTSEAALRERAAELGIAARIVTYDDHDQGLAALEAREIDVYFGDRAILDGLLVKAADRSALHLSNRLFTFEPYAIALARNDSDFRLMVDRSLAEFYRSADYLHLLATYFGEDRAAVDAVLVRSRSLPE